jgi:hypothetical protein
MKKFLILFVIVILSGCKSSKDNTLDTAAKVYVENIIIDEKYSFKEDTIKILRTQVFEKYKLPEAEYKKIFDGILTDKEKWDYFFKSAGDYLDTLKAKKLIK